jgi:hypothetical protein
MPMANALHLQQKTCAAIKQEPSIVKIAYISQYKVRIVKDEVAIPLSI